MSDNVFDTPAPGTGLGRGPGHWWRPVRQQPQHVPSPIPATHAHRLQSLRSNLASRQQKKRSQPDAAQDADSPSPPTLADDGSELCAPLPGFGLGGASLGSSDAELASRPKRRSVSVDLQGGGGGYGGPCGRGSVDIRVSVDATSGLHRRASVERRTSLDAWHEARRQRCARVTGGGRKPGSQVVRAGRQERPCPPPASAGPLHSTPSAPSLPPQKFNGCSRHHFHRQADHLQGAAGPHGGGRARR
jgi:hypothetical protein